MLHVDDTKATSASRSPALTSSATSMRALLHRRYGEPSDPGVLVMGTAEKPMAGVGEVVVAVHAANASIGDHHIVTGRPYLVRLSPWGGLPGPKNPIAGAVFAGRVAAIGDGVTTWRVGDAVMGETRCGSFAEFIAVKADVLAPAPKHLSLDEAAAVPWAMAAFQGLRDAGRVKAGTRVLINGASGGVGTWAVQIAKAMGAHVTAVCSTRNVELMGRLGADDVIDYSREDFVVGGARFDVLFDNIANRSLAECKSVLVENGIWVGCAGSGGDILGPIPRMIAALFTSMVSSQKLISFMATPNQKDLRALQELTEAHALRPVLERTVPLDEAAAALHQVGLGHARGQTVIQVADDGASMATGA
jgi:NADPH:quinone reductase-like Zn-dependent oxidoreductase